MAKIDLRPAWYIREREFYWPRLLLVTGIVIYGVLVFNLIFYLHYLQGEEMKRLDLLKVKEKGIAQEEGKSQEEMDSLLILQDRQKALDSFISKEHPWNSCLETIFREAGRGIEIEAVRGKDTGEFALEGISRDLEGVARYLDSLQGRGNFSDLKYQSIKWDPEGYFTFIFTGRRNLAGDLLEPPGGNGVLEGEKGFFLPGDTPVKTPEKPGFTETLIDGEGAGAEDERDIDTY